MGIVVRTTRPVRSYPAGTELGFATEAKARKVLGDDFDVVRAQDGQPASATPKRQRTKAQKRKRTPKTKVPTASTPEPEKQD